MSNDEFDKEDVPLVLWSGLGGLFVDAADPNGFSPLLIWTDFLQSGGRIALAVMLGALAGNRAANF